jgi:glutamine synthetase
VIELKDLRQAVADGTVDTVLLAVPDMQGRLQGKRLTVRHFLDEVVDNGAEACEYLLAVDVEMNTVGGYEFSSWDTGYGDFALQPDLATLRMIPWHEATALCIAQIVDHGGEPVAVAPRQVLAAQLDRLASRGWIANAATELEFIVFEQSYEQAWDQAYAGMTPANRYNVDYSLLGTARIEPLIRRMRNAMAGAGLAVEASKGECNRGQHEINFRYRDALRTADEHAIFKNGAKEIAAQEGVSITFMAKFDEREGNSCHIHLSLCDAGGGNVFHSEPAIFESFVAGQLAGLRELTLLLAPNVNSYKRFAAGSFAPTSVAWGRENRTCAFREVGHGESRRIECRVPGADVNPHMAIAALIAGGLHGVERELALEPPLPGNAYATDATRVPGTLREARDLFATSEIAADAFGPAVVAHYVNCADVELAAFESTVTDWERVRGFERL